MAPGRGRVTRWRGTRALRYSDRIRHEAGIATMAVSNVPSFTDVNTIPAAGRADLCARARARVEA